MAVVTDKRKNRREYNLKPTIINIKGSPFEVHNISSEGIGIIIEENGPQFTNGERIEKIPIPLEEGVVHLRGVVTHISVTSNSRICGIMFQFKGSEFKYLMQFKRERTV
jgi:hypothetical protein